MPYDIVIDLVVDIVAVIVVLFCVGIAATALLDK